MRKYVRCFAIIGVLAGFAFAEETASDSASAASKTMMKTLEHILAKAGISFDGEFQSKFGSADVGGGAKNLTRRSMETVEFTSVDFDIKARPNTVTQGRLIFRMQQDWRNFYSDISNPIFTRWVSIDGSVLQGMFSYNVGDFRQKFTPLTLYTPDINVLYEPEIFAEQRTVAKNEVFLEDNQRQMQGLNLNFAAEVYPIFNSLKANIVGSRLLNVETNIENGSKVTSVIERSPIEKYFAAGNVDMAFLQGVSAGASYLRIFDNKGSYGGNGTVLSTTASRVSADSVADTLAQNTGVLDFRGGVELSPFFNSKTWKFGLSFEFAGSNDDSSYYARRPVGNDTLPVLQSTSITGNAIRGGVKAGFNIENIFSFDVDAGFINNTSNFRNELAQTPDFFGRRIMNFENDRDSTSPFNACAPLYSTFDAMYQQVFKFSPSLYDKLYGGSSSWWYKEPFTKNSYTTMVLTQTELTKSRMSDTEKVDRKYYGNNYLKGEFLDPSVQLIMPFGAATPNRTGINTNVTLGFLENRIEAKVLFASLKEIDTTVVLDGSNPTPTAETLPRTTYSQMGGGVKADLASFIGWRYPIRLSSSVVISKASNDGILTDPVNYPAASITSTFYSENFYFKFWKRAAILAGAEFVNNVFATKFTENQNQLLTSIGLEYKLTDGSYITGLIGQIDVTNSSDDPTNIGAYDPSLRNFNQKLVSLFLRVMF